MNVARLLARARLRTVWLPLLAVSLVVALGGGATMAAVAGAIRTAQANDRVLTSLNAAEVSISYGSHDPDEIEALLREVEGVEETTLRVGFIAFAPELPPATLYFLGAFRDDHSVSRPLVEEGRFAELADEAILNRIAADRSGLQIGDRTTLLVADAEFSDFAEHQVEIVGIGVLHDELVEDETQAKPVVYLADAFIDAHRDRISHGNALLTVEDGAREHVLDGLDAAGFTSDVDLERRRRQSQDSVQVLVLSLVVLAMLSALATIAISAQALARLVRRSDADERSLKAIGVTTRQRAQADLLIATLAGTVGLAAGVVVAIAASPLFPVGRIGQVDLLRGVDVDALVLGATAVVLLFALVGTTGLVAGRRRRGSSQVRTGRAPGAVGSRPAIATGFRFTTGRRSVEVTVIGLALGTAVAVTALTFSGSLDRLIESPERSGMTWDLLGRSNWAFVDTDAVGDSLAGVAVNRATAVGLTTTVRFAGRPVPTSSWRSLIGSPWPTVVDGRAPSGPFEVLAGSRTLRERGLEIGDSVEVRIDRSQLSDGADDGSVAFEVTVVGTAISPAIGVAGADAPRLAEGLLLSMDDIEAATGAPISTDVVLFDLAGIDPNRFQAEHFPRGLPNLIDAPTEWFTSAEPSEVTEAASAQPAFVAGATGLVLAVIVTVVYSLIAFVRERRRSLAVLESIGFTSGQLRTTILTQGLLVVSAALALGVPVGIASGQWLWQSYATRLGVLADPAVPIVAISAAVLAAVLAAGVAALVPARMAAQSSTSHALQAE